MEIWLQIVLGFIGTLGAVVLGIATYNLSIKEYKDKQKKQEKEREEEKILQLFEKRDLILQEQTKEIKHNTELTIQKNIMPLIKTIQEQQKNLQDQVNTIMNELIDNTKTTNKRLTQLEIQTAINSVKKERNVK